MQSGELKHIEIHAVVFGRAQLRLERYLKASLRDAFTVVGAVTSITISHYPRIADSLNDQRQQHASGPYLKFLDVFNPNEPDSIKLGIIDQDLYSDSHASLNFIFGEARIGGNCCIISTFRLEPGFYNLPFNEKLYHARAVKEAVHEIGHVLGLAHCDNVQCIMHFSNCIDDTDIKHVKPCEACTEKLKKLVIARGKVRTTRVPVSSPD